MSPLFRVLEALLFASDKPMSPAECVKHFKGAVEAAGENVDLADLAKCKPAEVALALGELAAAYAAEQRGFRLIESGAGWKVVTAPETAPWVRQLSGEPAVALESFGPRDPRSGRLPATDHAGRHRSGARGQCGWGDADPARTRGRPDCRSRRCSGSTFALRHDRIFLEHFALRSLDELPNCAELRRVELPVAGQSEAQPVLPLDEVPATNGTEATPPAETALSEEAR